MGRVSAAAGVDVDDIDSDFLFSLGIRGADGGALTLDYRQMLYQLYLYMSE